MPIITIKVDEALKEQASVVLDELGLDVPTAIRMYLKSVVRENGLPIDTKLPKKPCCCKPAGKTITTDELFEEEPAPVIEDEPVVTVVEDEAAAETEPAVTAVEPVIEEETVGSIKPALDYETRSGRKAIAALFIDAICAVPAGSLTRWKDIEAKLSADYGTEVTKPASIRWPATKEDGTEIPYWRIVGDRGAVRGDKMIEMDVQKAKLEAEGHTFIDAGHGIFTGIKVEDWKKKLV